MNQMKNICSVFLLSILLIHFFFFNFDIQNDCSPHENCSDFIKISPDELEKKPITIQNMTKMSSYSKESTHDWLEKQLKDASLKYNEIYNIDTEEKFIEWLYEDLEIGWDESPDMWIEKFCPEVVEHFQKFPLAKSPDPGAVLFTSLSSSKHAAQSVSHLLNFTFQTCSSFSNILLY